MVPLSRRRVLTGGAVGLGMATGLGVGTGMLPGRERLARGLGLGEGSALGGSALEGSGPHPGRGRLVSGTFFSRARNTPVAWSCALPAGSEGGTGLPVVVALHGRGTDHSHFFGDLIGLDRLLAADGRLQFVVAAVDGGNTYWHPRSSGEDSGAMVTEEFLPLLAGRGLRTDRIGLFGFSMGGYGALRLAGQLGPTRVAAVVAVSPALWTSFEQTSAGAFDDAADFAAHDVMGRQHELRGIAVRVDCGSGDAFRSAVETYRAGFPRGDAPAGGIQEGGHDEDYWRRLAPAELAFLGRHLTS